MVLRGAAGAACALPLFDDIPRAHAQAKTADAGAAATGPIKRLLIMYSPNGGINEAVTKVASHESTGSGATFTPGPVYDPLVADGHKSDLTIVHGLDMGVAMLANAYGDAHGLGIGCMLTGTELAQGTMFQAGMGGPGSGWPGGISVDQFIAQKMPLRPRASIDFAIKRMSGSIWSRMSYAGANGQTVEPFDDPSVAFDSLFANVGMSTSAIDRQNRRRKSVLDEVNSELAALMGSLSGRDKDKLNTHLTLLRQIEMQLTVANAGTCTAPTRPVLTASAPVLYNASGMEVQQSPSADIDVPQRHDLARKMILAAMACDMSRVATIMMAPSRSDIFLTWVKNVLPAMKTESHHDLSHEGDSNTTAAQQLVIINQWYAQQVSEMIKLLKATPEGNGTMFDNTVIFWTNELGIGNGHTHTNIPYMLAGNAGGYFKTGQAVTIPSDSAHITNAHNRLLLSLIHSMGFTDVTAFGDPKYCAAGPIKEIAA
jgi:hypothetical protein